MISERPPFKEWHTEPGRIPTDLESDVELAVHAYQLSVFLDIAKNTYGLAVSEKIRTHILLLSTFDVTLESRLPILFEAFSAGVAVYHSNSFPRLVNDPKAEFHVTLAASIMFTSEWPEERKTKLLMPLAECLDRGRVWAEEIFRPELETAAEVTDMFEWSESPGPFERQLQRQQNNPIFPPTIRTVSTHQVVDARVRDLGGTRDFMQRYRPFVRRGLSLSGNWTMKEASDFLKEAIDLLEVCSVLGSYFESESKVLQSASEATERQIIETTGDASLRDSFREYRALSDIGATLQRIGTGFPPGCDAEEYTVRSVLSEDLETIGNYAAICKVSGLLADNSLERAQTIIAEAIREGMPQDVGKLKLAAFNSGLGDSKSKASSGIWAGLKRFIRRG